MKRIVQILLILIIVTVSQQAKADYLYEKPDSIHKTLSCNDINNSCQNRIINLLDHATTNVLIYNYDFSNQFINRAITRVVQSGIEVNIGTTSYALQRYNDIFKYYLNLHPKHVRVFIQDIEESNTQFIIIDNYITLTGKINGSLRTDLENRVFRKLNKPGNLLIIRSSALADAYINKFKAKYRNLKNV